MIRFVGKRRWPYQRNVYRYEVCVGYVTWEPNGINSMLFVPSDEWKKSGLSINIMKEVADEINKFRDALIEELRV